MKDCAKHKCPQDQRSGEDRRRDHRRHSDGKFIQWCASAMGPLIVGISVISISASVTISSVVTNTALAGFQSRLDAIREDVNQTHAELLLLKKASLSR